jgi:hypothetical protein
MLLSARIMLSRRSSFIRVSRYLCCLIIYGINEHVSCGKEKETFKKNPYIA